ncbi:unnamed protein product, partial [marine sediment metagenome]
DQLVCSEEDIAAQTFTFTFSNQGWAPNGDPKGQNDDIPRTPTTR